MNLTGDDAWTTGEVAAATDSATCGTLGTAAIEAVAEYKTFDWCLHVAVQTKVDAVESAAS